MDLGDRAVDAPARAHLAPVQDVFLHERRQLHRLIPLFLSRQKYMIEWPACQLQQRGMENCDPGLRSVGQKPASGSRKDCRSRECVLAEPSAITTLAGVTEG